MQMFLGLSGTRDKPKNVCLGGELILSQLKSCQEALPQIRLP